VILDLADEPGAAAIDLFRDRGPGRLPVVSDGQLVDTVTRSDVLWELPRQAVTSAEGPAEAAPPASQPS
jgi:hypothetical protein